MYCKLAWGNVRRSVRDYSIYFLTLTMSVAMFYAFSSMGIQAQYFDGERASAIRMLSMVMPTLTYLLMIVTGFLMIYANNYLIRRRKREFSLYQILGMRASGVSKVLILETAISTVIPAVVGIILGILISQLMVFISAALFHQKVTAFHFEVSLSSIAFCMVGLICMFIFMAIFNVRSIHKNDLIKMLHSDRENEVVHIKGIVPTFTATLVGFGLMAWAYMRLMHDGLPFLMADGASKMGEFGITTVMVFVGGVIFCYGASGALLYLCQATKSIYLRGLTAFTLRQLSSKLTSQSLSMATNAFFLFLAATIVSVGMSFGAQFNAIGYSAPYEATISFAATAESTQPTDINQDLLKGLVDTGKLPAEALNSPHATVYLYSLGDVDGAWDAIRWSKLAEASGIALPGTIKDNVNNGFEDISSPEVINESNYNAVRRLFGESEINLNNSHYLFGSQFSVSQDYLSQIQQSGTALTIAGQTLTPLDMPIDTGKSAAYENSYTPMNTIIVVPDSVVEGAQAHMAYLNILSNSDSITNTLYPDHNSDTVNAAFPLEEYISTSDATGISYQPFSVSTRDDLEVMAVTNYGTMAYLAIYIGLTFVLSCSVVLAIQQLASTADAGKSYTMLYRLGATRSEVSRSIFAQNALYFALPLGIALAHTACVIRIMQPALKLIGSDTTYIFICLLMFVLVYIAYFVLTFISCRAMVMTANMRTQRS